MRAFDLGRSLAKRHAIDASSDLTPALSGLNLEVIPWRFEGRIREVIFQNAIGIDAGLPDAWQRWLTAHAIGHHLLHAGTSLYLASWQWVNRNKDERQAEEFAAGLLVPPSAMANAGDHARASLPHPAREGAMDALEPQRTLAAPVVPAQAGRSPRPLGV